MRAEGLAEPPEPPEPSEAAQPTEPSQEGQAGRPWRVRLRPTRRMIAQVAGRLALTGVSVTFIVGGAADPASFGGALFLLLGGAGVALFGGATLALAGNLAGRRPILEIDDEGIRRPAGWPRRASRLLRWDDLAAVVACSQGIPAGRGHHQQMVFLPKGDPGIPGIADPRWSIPVSDAWDRSVEDVVSAVRRHREVPCTDRREPRRAARW